MLDSVGLIHMNGRVYDPRLARFLSVDPVNQAPGNGQSYNPYSYVYNSPMMLTDPSGFSAWTNTREHYVRPIVTVVVMYMMGPGGSWAMVPGTTAEAAFANTIIAGAIAGGIQSGTLEGAFQGGLTAAAFFGVGSITVGHGEEALHASAEMKVAQVVGHAAVACASAMASGGQCGPAAIAQAFTTSAGHLGLPEGRFAGTVSRAVVGGLASSLAGGKFSNGAVTAAFAYLFNELAKSEPRHSDQARMRAIPGAAEAMPMDTGESAALALSLADGVGIFKIGVALITRPTAVFELLGAAKGALSESRALTTFYPANEGFLGATNQLTLREGQVIDRFGGSEYSRFFAPPGTPTAARALPPGVADQPLRSFEVLRPFEVQSGTVAPAFGQFGLGTQYRSSMQLGDLLEKGFLREIK